MKNRPLKIILNILVVLSALIGRLTDPRSKQYKQGYQVGQRNGSTRDNPYQDSSAKGVKAPEGKWYSSRLRKFKDWNSGLIRGLHDAGHL